MTRRPPLATEYRAFDEARRRNERWITGFVMVAAATMAVVGSVRVGEGNQLLGSVTQVAAGAILLYYGFAWWRAGHQVPSNLQLGLRTVIETSVATIVMVVQAPAGPTEVLLNAPVLIYVLAIFVSILRLRPALPLIAGVLAGVQWLITWAVFAPPEAAAYDGLTTLGAVQRTVLLCLCGVLAYRIGRSLRVLTDRVAETVLEREQVRRAFGAYVAEPVVERVLSGDLKLDTERRVISVMFVDIRGFTSFSAGREPTEVLEHLNRALEAFSIEIRDRSGIVNKFLGDGLMALFGAPLNAPFHAREAAKAALAIADAAQSLADSGAYPDLRIGIGLHCGEVVVGDIGGRGHREYTAIGDVVNVASRVESMTKEVGATVLITEAVVNAIGDGFTLGQAQTVQLRGRERPIAVYTLDGGPADDAAPVAMPATGR